MLLISSRENFWDNNRFSTKKDSEKIDNEIRDFDLETLYYYPVKLADFIKLIKDKKVLLLIHGYNCKEYKVVGAYKTIEKKVKEIITKQGEKYHDLIIGYTWPGGDDFSDYFEAKDRAEKIVSTSVKPLITKMIEHCKEVDIMAHSMGCRISLMVMNDLKKNNVRKKILRLYLMAAAVDNDSIEKGQSFYEGSTYCDNTYIFHSKFDPVLRVKDWWYTLRWMFTGEWIYPWKEGSDALGYSGPENPDPDRINKNVKVINCKEKIKTHGGYKGEKNIYIYIGKELTGKDKDKAPQFSTLS